MLLPFPMNLPLMILVRRVTLPCYLAQPFPCDLPHVLQGLLHPLYRPPQPCGPFCQVQILCLPEGWRRMAFLFPRLGLDASGR